MHLQSQKSLHSQGTVKEISLLGSLSFSNGTVEMIDKNIITHCHNLPSKYRSEGEYQKL